MDCCELGFWDLSNGTDAASSSTFVTGQRELRSSIISSGRVDKKVCLWVERCFAILTASTASGGPWADGLSIAGKNTLAQGNLITDATDVSRRPLLPFIN